MREEVRRRLLQVAGPWLHREGLVLDAGCGTGWWLDALARDGVPSAGAPGAQAGARASVRAGVPQSRLVGIDLLEERVAAARARVPGARLMQGDVRALPVADGSCTLVLLFTVLSAMGGREEVRRALHEVRRVLEPGGAVAIWEPRVWSPNSNTRLIRLRELRAGLGGDLSVRSVTLLPPLARRAGRCCEPLARVPLLRSHRLVLARP